MKSLDALTSAEETKVKQAGRLQDQIKMLSTIVAAKDSQSSDVLQSFIESSESQVAQLIINHGKQQGALTPKSMLYVSSLMYAKLNAC